VLVDLQRASQEVNVTYAILDGGNGQASARNPRAAGSEYGLSRRRKRDYAAIK